MNRLTHFAIFYKKHIEWDEAAEVENINIVFHSHLPGKQQGKNEGDKGNQVGGRAVRCLATHLPAVLLSVRAGPPKSRHTSLSALLTPLSLPQPLQQGCLHGTTSTHRIICSVTSHLCDYLQQQILLTKCQFRIFLILIRAISNTMDISLFLYNR